jgi:hypothetical protein
MRPDFRNYRGVGLVALVHSAKGSTWEEHKYIKRLDGTYYYPDSYKGGRHLDSGDTNDSSNSKASAFKDKFAELVKNGEAYKDPDEKYSDMDLDDFRDLYNDIMGTSSTSDADLKKILASLQQDEGSGNEESFTLTSDEIDSLAKEVIRGNFGNGDERKEAIGEHYQEIQNRVNEIMKTSTVSTTKVSEASEEVVDSGTKAVTKAVSTSTAKGIDLEKVYNVYRNKTS